MDFLAIQRSLTILEDRYWELREIGEQRFAALEAEKFELQQQLNSQGKALQQMQKAHNEQALRVQVLEGELVTLKAECDAAVAEKAAAEKSAAALRQQLNVQAERLLQIQQTRDEQANRLKALESELTELTTERDTMVAGLQRLRHLAQPAGATRL